MGLFEQGDFTLASGRKSAWKIECDALSWQEWDTLALMASEILPQFGEVVGVPRGGVAFAEALARYATDGPLLIAEDVVTTGGSMQTLRNTFSQTRPVIGVTVFARSACPLWITPLFRMTEPGMRLVPGRIVPPS